MLTQSQLKARLSYNPLTGYLTWKNNNLVKAYLRNNLAGYSCKRQSKPTINYIYTSHRTQILGFKYVTSNLVWLYHKGKLPKGYIDHIDGNTLNNKIDNLRDVSHTINCRNAKLNTRNKTGIAGIRWIKRDKIFIVTLSRIILYYGHDLFEACCIRLSALNKSEHGYHPNHGRTV